MLLNALEKGIIIAFYDKCNWGDNFRIFRV